MLLISTVLFAQTSDNVIVNNLVNKNFSALLPTLDSLGVYYHLHKIKSSANGDKEVIITIANSATVGKLYTIQTTPEGVQWIQINYLHGVLQQVKSLDSLKGYYTKRVGRYSTNIRFYSTSYAGKHLATKWFGHVIDAKHYITHFPKHLASVYMDKTGKLLVGMKVRENDSTLYFIDGTAIPKKDMKPIKY